MVATLTYVGSTKSQKNGKTYVTVLNPNNFAKLTMELQGQASLHGLNQGDLVDCVVDLGGDGFRVQLAIKEIRKAAA